MYFTRRSSARRNLLFVQVAVCQCVFAADPAESRYSPHAREHFPEKLYWGDTHLHTNLSADAYGFGNNLTPEDAYRFARGETVISNTGQPARLSRPLDFIVVADHAEYLGIAAMLDNQADQLANSQIGQRWLEFLKAGKRQQILLDSQQVSTGELNVSTDPRVTRSVWAKVAEAADHNNDTGKFTAFIGFEWSSLPNGNNLHRNVVFRDGADVVKHTLPFSALDSRNPEDLWRYLQDYEQRTGGKVLAIPHNGNISNGQMFSDKTFQGEPLTSANARTRARSEPMPSSKYAAAGYAAVWSTGNTREALFDALPAPSTRRDSGASVHLTCLVYAMTCRYR